MQVIVMSLVAEQLIGQEQNLACAGAYDVPGG